MFGVLTLAALVVVLVSGALLAVGGVAWWHTSGLGHYVNSTCTCGAWSSSSRSW